MKTARLNVAGMTCGHCKAAVENSLKSQSGVRNASVDLGAGSAEVEYDETRVVPEQLVAAVRESGYEAQIAGSDVAGAP